MTTQRNETSNLINFNQWLDSLGKTRVTGWRWRREGIIQTIDIFGKLYITKAEIARFEERALAGEFHREQPFVRQQVAA